MDHYLGKDTVQNLLVLRFGNGIFEPLWNRNYVDHVEITAAETLGVERRGGFYETAGALRDMIQSRSEEHTSELQSRQYLVCRLLLGKKTHNMQRQVLH